MVTDRRVGRRNLGVHRHGLLGLRLGLAERPLGARPVVLSGVVLLGIGLVASSHATSLIGFQILFGGLVGIAGGAFYAPLMTVASAWFDRHRNLAVALISAGMGVAPLTVAPFARWLITAYDWRTAMLVVGIAATVLLVPVSLLIRRPPPAIPPPGMPEHRPSVQAAPAMTRRRRSAPPPSSRSRSPTSAAARHTRGRSSTW
jgi:MFS family permease